MGGFLTRIKQFGLKINTTEGVAEDVTAAPSNYSLNYKGAKFTPKATRFDRANDRPGLSEQQDLVGACYGTISIDQVEMAGGTGTTVPNWDQIFRNAGFTRTAMKRIRVDSITGGAFQIGDIIGDNATYGSLTKKGRVMGVATYTAHTYLIYVPLTGTFADTDTIYNYASPQVHGTQNGAAAANAGHFYAPISENGTTIPPDSTAELRDGENVHRLVGARANFTFSMNFGEPPLLKNVSIEGPMQMQNTGGDPIRDGFVAGVPSAPKPTYLMGTIGAPITIGDAGFNPKLKSFSLDIGNTLTPDQTITNGGVIGFLTEGYGGGYGPTRITKRTCVFKIDPTRPVYTTFDFYKQWFTNGTMPFRGQSGLLNASGKLALTFFAPAVGFTSDTFQEADDNGIVRINQDLKCTGDNDDEIFFALVEA